MMWGSSAIWQRFWSSLWLHFSVLSGRLSCKGSVLRLLLFMVANDFKVTASPYVTLCRVVVVKSLSCVQFFVTRWTATHQAPLSSTISWSLLKFKSIESVILSNHLILCHPLLLPSIFPSNRVFPSESALCIRWPKYCIFSFSNSPSIEESGLISFRIDWFDLLPVQGTLKSLLQVKLQKKKKKAYPFLLCCYQSHLS